MRRKTGKAKWGLLGRMVVALAREVNFQEMRPGA
jgi:hypothetical protein